VNRTFDTGRMSDHRGGHNHGGKPDGGTKMTADGPSVDMSILTDLLDIGSLTGGRLAIGNLGGNFGELLDKAGLGGAGKDSFGSFMTAFAGQGFEGKTGLDGLGALFDALDAFGGTDDDSLFKARFEAAGADKAALFKMAVMAAIEDISQLSSTTEWSQAISDFPI
jgi:hypothetical protein